MSSCDNFGYTDNFRGVTLFSVPGKVLNRIILERMKGEVDKNSYEGMLCRGVHDGQLTKNFEIRTGVRQGCLLSPFVFILAIDWIMKTETK